MLPDEQLQCKNSTGHPDTPMSHRKPHIALIIYHWANSPKTSTNIFTSQDYVYIYMLPRSVLTSPPWYGPRHTVPPLGYARLLAFHLPLFPHLVKFVANTMQINTACKDYDSINQHSHQSTRTTGPQGGRGANHDHAQGGEGRSDAGAYTVYVQSFKIDYYIVV